MFRALLVLAILAVPATSFAQKQSIERFVRIQIGERTAYGILDDDDTVREIEGDLFGTWKKTNKTHALKSVKLLAPTEPRNVLAMAGNYHTHLRNTPVPEKFQIPQPFFKSPSSLVGQGDKIVLPADMQDVHFEAELVIVIGKTCKNVTKEQAGDYIFGVTIGNDVSARAWQKNDIQWWRAKASDTFGPCGPWIIRGIAYDDLDMKLKLNGEVKQHQRTKDLIHDCRTCVSFISQHMTLYPGDLIFTGTPGETSKMKDGDIVEVEIEKIGTLRNPVIAAKGK